MKQAIFNDPEEFMSQLSNVSCDMWITAVRKRQWIYQKICLGDIVLQRGDLSSGNLVNFCTPKLGVMIYMLDESEGGSRLNGREVSSGSATLLPQDHEFILSHRHPHRWMTLFVPGIHEKCLPMASPHCSSLDNPSGLGPSLDSGLIANRFLGAARDVFTAATMTDHFEDSPAARQAREHLLGLAHAFSFGGLTNPAKGMKGRPPVNRSSVLAACHHYLASVSQEDVCLQDMVSHSGVSSRMLRMIFNEYFGFSPARFLQLRQLHCVQRVLREANPNTTRVTQVLTRYGVWNFNHFGRRYKDFFGETPSTTLLAH